MFGLILLSLIVGALIAVIWGKNAAKGFMGCVGSLALGVVAFVVVLAFLLWRDGNQQELPSAVPATATVTSPSAAPSGPRVGVVELPLRSDSAARLGFPAGCGLYVAQVTPGSPADSAHIMVGDVISQVDGHWATMQDDITAAVNSKPPGSTVTLSVVRNGIAYNVSVQPQ